MIEKDQKVLVKSSTENRKPIRDGCNLDFRCGIIYWSAFDVT